MLAAHRPEQRARGTHGVRPSQPALKAQIHQLLPNAHVINAYGTTEGSPRGVRPASDGLPTPAQSVGYPHPAVAVRGWSTSRVRRPTKVCSSCVAPG